MEKVARQWPVQLLWYHLRDLVEPEQKLIEFLEDTLDISRSTAYDRLNGNLPLKADELYRIVKAQPEVLVRLTSPTHFLGDYHLSQSVQFKDLAGLQQYLEQVETCFADAVERSAVLRYTALDYPLFYFLSDPDLLTYKFNYWSNSLFEKPIKTLPTAIHRRASAIYELYQQLESEEIWSGNMHQRQESQLEELLANDFLSASEHQRILDILSGIQRRAKEWKAQGQKASGGRFHLHALKSSSLNNAGVLHYPDGSAIWMGAINSCHFLRASYTDMVEKFMEDFAIWKRMVA